MHLGGAIYFSLTPLVGLWHLLSTASRYLAPHLPFPSAREKNALVNIASLSCFYSSRCPRSKSIFDLLDVVAE